MRAKPVCAARPYQSLHMPESRWLGGRTPLGTAAAFLVILTGTAYLLLGIKPQQLPDQRSLLELWNTGHLLLFFLVYLSGCALLQNLVTRQSLAKLLALAAASSLVLGIVTEYLQGKVGREPSLQDLALNTLGALYGCCIFLLLARRHTVRARGAPDPMRVYQALGALLLATALVLMPLWKALLDERLQARQFPVLATYTSKLETGRHRSSVSTVFTPGGLLVEFLGSGYAHINWKYLARDWTGFNELAIEVDNQSGADLKLTCRVHDRAHEKSYRYDDRFNRTFVLRKGRQTLLVDLREVQAAPATRNMDLQEIAALICFTSGEKTARRVVFEEIRLQ